MRLARGASQIGGSLYSARENTLKMREQGQALAHRPPVDRSGEMTGALVLDTISAMWFHRYAETSEAAETFLTLWAAHTWYREDDGALSWRVSPRAWLLSKEPGSGKSLVLELMALVSARAESIEIEPTAPGLKMMLGREKGSVFLDEGDILFGKGARKEAVRAILNAGYSRMGLGGTVTTGHGGGPNRIAVFGPVALAGLDVLETHTDDKLTALLSRGVKIRMRKGTPPRDLADDMMNGTAERDAAAGRKALEWWAVESRERALRGPKPEMPPELTGRVAQIWEPLFRIAEAAGGDWPLRTWEAALLLSTSAGKRREVEADFWAAFGRGEEEQ
jgi:hypothetical protein